MLSSLKPNLFSGGRFAKPVTRLSFRRKKKKSFLKMLAIKGKNPKVDSEELMDDTGISYFNLQSNVSNNITIYDVCINIVLL